MVLNPDPRQLIVMVLGVIVGCIAAGLAHKNHRRTYRLSSSKPRTRDTLQVPLLGGVIFSALLFYLTWISDWIKPLAANIALGLVGGFVFAVVFGLTYWFSDRVIRYPDPLPVAYRFTKEELALYPPFRQRKFWSACLAVVLSMEILERKVFGDVAVVRESLNIGGTFFFALVLIASTIVKMPHYRAVEQLNKETKARESLAAKSSPIVLPQSAESAR